MEYEIEINLARKGWRPFWASTTDENGGILVWKTEDEARAVLAAEARGADARIVRFGPESTFSVLD